VDHLTREQNGSDDRGRKLEPAGAGKRGANAIMGRQRKYNSEHHRKLRARVTRFRADHAAEIRETAEHKRLMSLKRVGGWRKQRYFLYEIVNESGKPIDVLITMEDQPPAGAIRSRFLPSVPMSPSLARMIRDARLSQLVEWRFADDRSAQ
jgi:hypothetical protein